MVLGAQAPGRVGRRRITSEGPRERPFVVLDSPRWNLDGARARRSSARSDRRAPPSGRRGSRRCADPEIPAGFRAPSRTRRERARVLAWAEGQKRGDPARDRRRVGLGAIGLGVNADGDRADRLLGRCDARGRGVATPPSGSSPAGRSARAARARRADTDPDNLASQRVAEKAGFSREGVLARTPHATAADGPVLFSPYPASSRSASSRRAAADA